MGNRRAGKHGAASRGEGDGGSRRQGSAAAGSDLRRRKPEPRWNLADHRSATIARTISAWILGFLSMFTWNVLQSPTSMLESSPLNSGTATSGEPQPGAW